MRVEVGNEDLTMSRFALSPLWELTHALRLLAGPSDTSVLRPWLVRARDRYLAQGRQVTAPYGPDQDVWFRYRDERDLNAWFRLLPVLLPGVLRVVRLRLG